MKSLLPSLFFIFTLSIAAAETKEFKIDLPRDWKVEKIKDSKTDYRHEANGETVPRNHLLLEYAFHNKLDLVHDLELMC